MDEAAVRALLVDRLGVDPEDVRIDDTFGVVSVDQDADAGPTVEVDASSISVDDGRVSMYAEHNDDIPGTLDRCLAAVAAFHAPRPVTP